MWCAAKIATRFSRSAPASKRATSTARTALTARRADRRCSPVSAPTTRSTSRVTVSRAMSRRSEEHTSELQSLMRISYAVFCLKKKIHTHATTVKQYYLYLNYLSPTQQQTKNNQ